MPIKMIHVKHMLKDMASRFWDIKPASLFMILTQKCNAHCNMCDIWRSGIGPGKEMSVPDYARTLADPVFSNVLKATLTGGESLLREDIPDIIAAMLDVLPRLGKITIASNGLASRLIRDRVSAICGVIQAKKPTCQLNIQISCDGVSEIHDQIRGEGAKRKVAETFRGLKELRENHEFLIISSVCVIQPLNIDEALAVDDYLRDSGIAPIFTCACLSDTYYKNSEFEGISFSQDHKKRTSAIFRELIEREKDFGKRALYREFIGMLAGGSNTRNCPTLRHIASISQCGDMFPCLNAMDSRLGNVLTDSPSKLWFSRKRREEALRIKAEKCPACMFACGMGYWEVFKHNMSHAIELGLAKKR